MHSRYARPLVVPDPVSEPHECLELLSEVGRAIETRAVLLPTGEAPLRLASANREALGEVYDFCLPERETLAVLCDKRLQYARLGELGTALPLTISPNFADEAADAFGKLGSPCLMKPAVSDLWTATRKSKLRVIRNADDARTAYLEMEAAGCGAVMQEFIPGPDTDVLAAHSYTSTEGRFLGTAVKRKVRQDPPGFGNGSYYMTVEHEGVIAEAVRLLEGLRYRGIAGTEFKIDARDGRLKLMEINPRTAASGHVITAAGIDLPWLLYQDVTGASPAAQRDYRIGVRGVNLSWDWRSMRRSRVASPWAWAKWAASVARADTFAACSWDDLGPMRSILRRVTN